VRLAFLGTPEASVPSLRALIDAGHDVALVITRPDRKRGRGGRLSPSPVKECAQELGLRVGHRLGDLDGVKVERGVVVAYGRLVPSELLERIPMLNVHFSLLPKWRGAAPVERAMLAGDEETGVSIMTLEPELDTGPVHLEKRVAIDDKTLATLLDELATLGAQALTEVLGSPQLLANPHAQERRRDVRRETHQRGLSPHVLFVAHAATSNSSIGPGVPRSGESSDSGRECGVIRRRRSGEWFDHAAKRSGRAGRFGGSDRAGAGAPRKREIHECVVVVVRCAFRSRRRAMDLNKPDRE
jgi:hypothetical protein